MIVMLFLVRWKRDLVKRMSSTVRAGSASTYRSSAMENLTVETTVMRRSTGGWKTHQKFLNQEVFGGTHRIHIVFIIQELIISNIFQNKAIAWDFSKYFLLDKR